MKYKSFYILSIIIVILASVYPIYMGIITLKSQIQKGFVNAFDYPKYIIPYTPICIALITTIVLMPIIFKVFKRYTFPIISLFGTMIFFASEIGFEHIRVIKGYVKMPLESWQLSLCAATPQVLRAIGKPIYAANNPVFKIHFYIIAIVIILAVLNVIYGFSKMLREKNYSKRRPLLVQAISVILFICLCILACFTAFYRNGTINISPLSASLMTIFFIVFGTTAGLYCGSIFYIKGKFLSIILPALTAMVTTVVMYIGELVLMDGVLYRYGTLFIFKPIGVIPLSIADILIILASGVITYYIMKTIKNVNQPS